MADIKLLYTIEGTKNTVTKEGSVEGTKKTEAGYVNRIDNLLIRQRKSVLFVGEADFTFIL